MKLIKTLRGKLFFWYATSLATITGYFYLAVHFYSLPFGNVIFFLLLIILALVGFIIIRRMTNDLIKLSSKIKSITSQNLDEKIQDINSEDEIGELAVAFNQLLDRLSGAFRRERQFIGDVAHELKTPIAILQTNTDVMLSRDRKKEEYRQTLNDMQADIKRITDTVKNILDLAWSEADQAHILTDTVSLSDVMSDLKEIAAKLGSSKHITVHGKIEKGVIVLGKEDKLFKAFINVIENAILYTPKRGIITLSMHAHEHKAIIHINDTGIGISEKDVQHIFERFYRGEKTGKTFGSGLGLAIAKATIKAHSGTIDVKSTVGKGTTFTVALPLKSS